MSNEASRQRFYEEAARFIAHHEGAADLSWRMFALERKIHAHFRNPGFEAKFCGLLEDWVDAQLARHPMPDAHLHLRRFG